MLWAMFCWEPLGSALHVGVTLTSPTYPTVPQHGGWGPAIKANTVQEHNQFEELTSKFPRSASNPASVGGAAIHLTGLEGCAAKFSVPDTTNTTAHLQGSGGVKVSMDQGCFSSNGVR